MILSSHGIIGSQIVQFSGLLDTYTGAAAAYSLRLLSTSYTGSAIKVRRASDNTEQDIGFSNNELDTTSLASFCSGTNGFVTTWYDQSGNGVNVTQTTAANQPKIYDSSTGVITENGKAAVQFDGSDDAMLNSSLTNTNLSSFYINQVISHNGLTDNRSSVSLSDGTSTPTGNSFFTIYPYRNQTYRVFFNGLSITFGNNPISSGQLSLIFEQISNTERNGYINSSLIGADTSNKTISDLNNIYIGRNDLGQFFSGKIQETIFYTSDQSSNRTGIETNINNFYSIY